MIILKLNNTHSIVSYKHEEFKPGHNMSVLHDSDLNSTPSGKVELQWSPSYIGAGSVHVRFFSLIPSGPHVVLHAVQSPQEAQLP